jgi:hypothetical protein
MLAMFITDTITADAAILNVNFNGIPIFLVHTVHIYILFIRVLLSFQKIILFGLRLLHINNWEQKLQDARDKTTNFR